MTDTSRTLNIAHHASPSAEVLKDDEVPTLILRLKAPPMASGYDRVRHLRCLPFHEC